MLTLRNISVWDTGELIDLIIPECDHARLITEPGAAAEGDIDASGLVVAPGFEDPHVHFRDPGETDKETMRTGCAAAASGGYTNVLLMPNTIPALDGVHLKRGDPGADVVLDAGYDETIDYLQHYEAVYGLALASRYCLSVCASKARAGFAPTDPNDWRAYLATSRTGDHDPYRLAHPVRAITDDGSAVTDQTLDMALEHAKATGLPLLEHCEHHEGGVINDGQVSRKLGVPGIPADTELSIVVRDIEASRRTGAPVHFQHVSTAAAFDAIRKAKDDGLAITCETAPHYLALCDEDLLEYGAMAKMNPPLRSRKDRDATIAAVCDGTVDMLATDHAPHTLEEKQAGLEDAPNGIIGLETAYGVCHSVLVGGGHMSDAGLIALFSTAPARLLGRAATNVARLVNDCATGEEQRRLDLEDVADADAVDLTILDPNEEWVVDPERFHSKARNTPFAGWKLMGRPLATVVGSKLVFSRIPVSTGR